MTRRQLEGLLKRNLEDRAEDEHVICVAPDVRKTLQQCRLDLCIAEPSRSAAHICASAAPRVASLRRQCSSLTTSPFARYSVGYMKNITLELAHALNTTRRKLGSLAHKQQAEIETLAQQASAAKARLAAAQLEHADELAATDARHAAELADARRRCDEDKAEAARLKAMMGELEGEEGELERKPTRSTMPALGRSGAGLLCGHCPLTWSVQGLLFALWALPIDVERAGPVSTGALPFA